MGGHPPREEKKFAAVVRTRRGSFWAAGHNSTGGRGEEESKNAPSKEILYLPFAYLALFR